MPRSIKMATIISELELLIDQSWLQQLVQQLYAELAQVGLGNFQPIAYFGDEWFSPDGIAAISIPFFLANKELQKIEMHQMGWVEGGTQDECMKLLRHESGHCFDHFFETSKLPDFQKIFGDPKKPYMPDFFLGKPFSKNFVKHLDRTYSQSHPAEDFAECFATVVTPRLDWKKKYKNAEKVLRKLEWTQLQINIHSKSDTSKLPIKEPEFYNQKNLNLSLKSYYAKRIRHLKHFHLLKKDKELKRIFNSQKDEPQKKSRRLLRPYQKSLMSIANAKSFYKYQIKEYINELEMRCYHLGLTENDKVHQNKTLELKSLVEDTLYKRHFMVK
tara:strand:+ start:2260 stop:3249 length:990 start_codon:yes stop_codon:yes gene_type:complete